MNDKIKKQSKPVIYYTDEQLRELRSVEMDLYEKFSAVCEMHGLHYVTGFGTTLGAIRHKGFIPWDDDMDFLMPRADYEKLVQIAKTEFTGKYEFLEPRTADGYVMAFAKLSRRDSTFVEATDGPVRYHRGIFIDIFPMDYWPQNKKKRDRLAFHAYCLLRLCVLAEYRIPKFPAGMSEKKRTLAAAGCSLIHGVLKLLHLSAPKLYRRYLSLAEKTSAKEAEHFVTDLCWCWIRKDGMIGLQYKDADLFTTIRVPFEDRTISVPEKYDSYLTIAYRDYMKLPPEDRRHTHAPSKLQFPEKI